MDIFIGSIPFKLKEEDLRKTFELYGEVSSVKIIIDKITRQNKGFGFIGMPNDDEALKAIEALNGSELGGRTIVVNKSEEKPRVAPRSHSSDMYSNNRSDDGNSTSKNKGGSRNFRTPDKKKGEEYRKGNFSKNKNNKGGRSF